jgi:ParB family transcriptional regulator, chromosome partitioning protein
LPASPKEGRLLKLSPKEILPNKENPRLIFDDEPLGYLRESISEVGILVPLTIFQRSSDGKYVLLDGERRLKCAISLGMNDVPCNIIEEPTKIENILRMFNIHNTRVEWELIPTAMKLETVMRLLGPKSNTELAKLTGMSVIRVSECKKILSFSKRYLDMALVVRKDKRITGDFFSQLHRFLEEVDRIPELRSVFSRDQITDIMIEKYLNGSFPAILDFRILKNALADARKLKVEKKHVVKTTREFLESRPPPPKLVTSTYEPKKIEKNLSMDRPSAEKRSMSPREYYEATTGSTYVIDAVLKAARKLDESLREMNVDEALSNASLVTSLNKLRATIDRIIGKSEK